MSSVFLRLRSKRYFMRVVARLPFRRENRLYRQTEPPFGRFSLAKKHLGEVLFLLQLREQLA